jgi:glutathione synthase/RimK-type ligase-like ATP-grasp enzyme
LPTHDIAIVVAPGSQSTSATLSEIDRLVRNWPKPVLNRPRNIFALERDRLHVLLKTVSGVHIPTTVRISRERLLDVRHNSALLRDFIGDGDFPLIVRPVDSHAGRGLKKIDLAFDIEAYLTERPERDFFISPFIDYSSSDGLFRKYRIIFVDGRPYACHMAISDQWRIWYYNADMAANEAKRSEEARFMANFDHDFVRRHDVTLTEIARRIDLEYFGIDCAETKTGELLIFEADNVMIAHNMDSRAIFPYKEASMRRLFDSFATMLCQRAHSARVVAA